MSVRVGLVNRSLVSPLAASSTLKPSGSGGKKGVNSALMLTSLVDAFSILVLFLMMNSSSVPVQAETGKVTLPDSHSGAGIIEKTTTLRLEGDDLLLNDEKVGMASLAQALTQIHEAAELEKIENRDSILLIADKDLDYLKMNTLVLQATEAGFKNFKFAVVKK